MVHCSFFILLAPVPVARVIPRRLEVRVRELPAAWRRLRRLSRPVRIDRRRRLEIVLIGPARVAARRRHHILTAVGPVQVPGARHSPAAIAARASAITTAAAWSAGEWLP